MTTKIYKSYSEFIAREDRDDNGVSEDFAKENPDYEKANETGWVEVLAGKEGAALAKKTSTLFAAMMIYKKSSPIRVSPVRFFESNEVAMADMKRCADEEAKLIQSK